jgi:hypothetical protein
MCGNDIRFNEYFPKKLFGFFPGGSQKLPESPQPLSPQVAQ